MWENQLPMKLYLDIFAGEFVKPKKCLLALFLTIAAFIRLSSLPLYCLRLKDL